MTHPPRRRRRAFTTDTVSPLLHSLLVEGPQSAAELVVDLKSCSRDVRTALTQGQRFGYVDVDPDSEKPLLFRITAAGAALLAELEPEVSTDPDCAIGEGIVARALRTQPISIFHIGARA